MLGTVGQASFPKTLMGQNREHHRSVLNNLILDPSIAVLVACVLFTDSPASLRASYNTDSVLVLFKGKCLEIL